MNKLNGKSKKVKAQSYFPSLEGLGVGILSNRKKVTK